ncbi:MAG TPA: VanZ family protein [Micropepsaceae bacterium]|nr:VanZ family protein [Micropepsaceae bacterium]
MKEPPRHALSPGGSDKKGGVIREAQGFASAGQIGQLPTMKLPRPLLHAARIADEILFYPALVLVIWGELTGPEPQVLDFFGDFSDKALHFIAYFGLAAMAAAGFKSRRAVVLTGLSLIVLGGVLEIVQGFTGRDMSFYDELANTAGVGAGAILARAIIEPLRRRLEYW